MLHVATVHWQTDRWIDLQLRHIARHVKEPYRVYAFLNDVPGQHTSKFFYTSTERIEDHATKLNLLADVIAFSASDSSDLVMFIDGDAFPVAPIDDVVRRLWDHQLAAVQRRENDGEPQPHPCFCLTSIGFWKTIGGDWHRGFEWLDSWGKPVTDVGGNLLESLERAGTDWYPLRRVNKHDLHPLFFGVYGDRADGPVVYHHGAGFRAGLSRVDFSRAPLRDADARLPSRLVRRLPNHGPLASVRRRYDPARRLKLERTEKVRLLSEEVLTRIESNDDFWRELV